MEWTVVGRIRTLSNPYCKTIRLPCLILMFHKSNNNTIQWMETLTIKEVNKCLQEKIIEALFQWMKSKFQIWDRCNKMCQMPMLPLMSMLWEVICQLLALLPQVLITWKIVNKDTCKLLEEIINKVLMQIYKRGSHSQVSVAIMEIHFSITTMLKLWETQEVNGMQVDQSERNSLSLNNLELSIRRI